MLIKIYICHLLVAVLAKDPNIALVNERFNIKSHKI